MNALQQIRFLYAEIGLTVNGKWWRWFTVWFSGGLGVVAAYRLQRFLYLLFGRSYALLKILFAPLFWLLGIMSYKHDISYQAEIGKGLRVLHPALGVVVSGDCIAGERLTLTGGNCIGQRKAMKRGDLVIGSRVTLGANAVVLGPIRIGDRCQIGAGAVAVHDAPAGTVWGGVPARLIQAKGASGDRPEMDVPVSAQSV